MTLLDSLLDAIIRLDGDALIMHVGEKPYVVLSSTAMNSYRGPVSWGQVELSSRPLTSEAVMGMLGQMLSLDQRQTLHDLGAVEHEIEAPGHPGRHFIVTAARGGDDVWVEVRRRPAIVAPAEDEIAVVAAPAAAPTLPSEQAVAAEPSVEIPQTGESEQPMPLAADPSTDSESSRALSRDEVVEIAPAELAPHAAAEIDPGAGRSVPELEEAPAQALAGEPEPQSVVFQFHRDPQETSGPPPISDTEPASEPTAWELAAGLVDETTETWEILEMPSATSTADAVSVGSATLTADATDWTPAVSIDLGEALRDAEQHADVEADSPDRRGSAAAAPPPEIDVHLAPVDIPASAAVSEAAAVPEDTAPFSVVLPIIRPALKLQPSPPPAAGAASTEGLLVELLRLAASRRASTVYAVAGSRPMIRTDAEIVLLGTEPITPGSEIERFAFEFAPREEFTAEWTCTVQGVGRVRCVTFHDHDGAGLILHLPSPNVSTADELGLEPQVQALCDQPDGLIVIAGPRSSGKSTLLGAFVDLINRTRKDHVITIESSIRTVHEKRGSFISQREVRGDGEALAAAARVALREGPDVLIIEDLRAPEAITVALDAAMAGRLVFGAISAPTASVAVERIIEAFAAPRRPQVQALLSGALRAVVAQILVTKPAGGRVGARELLINNSAITRLILEGATAQLPAAVEGGRRLGMKTMIDSLGELVRDGVVDAAEACRRAPDRAALVAALQRDGIDVSNLERRA